MSNRKIQSSQGKPSQLSMFQETDSKVSNHKAEVAAVQLAVQFTEELELPQKYRIKKSKAKTNRKPSQLDARFQVNIKHWKELILIMLDTLDHELAWRFINLKPAKSNPKESKTTNQDFIDFVGYLSLRRDKQKCDDDELGRLSMLLMAFQREVEKA